MRDVLHMLRRFKLEYRQLCIETRKNGVVMKSGVLKRIGRSALTTILAVSLSLMMMPTVAFADDPDLPTKGAGPVPSG